MRLPAQKPAITPETATLMTQALYKIFPDIIDDIIEAITGIEDGDVNDIGTFFIQLKTLLSGGTVTSPFPNLIGLALPTIQSMVNQISDIFNGLIVTPINAAIQGVKDWFADLVGWRSTTTTNVSAASSAASSASSAASAASTNANNLATNINNAISGGVAAGAGAIAGVFDTIGNIFGVASAASAAAVAAQSQLCLLYTSPSPRDGLLSRMPSSA